jgi:hypothetical protein
MSKMCTKARNKWKKRKEKERRRTLERVFERITGGRMYLRSNENFDNK